MDTYSARHPSDLLLHPVLVMDCDAATCVHQSPRHCVCRYECKLLVVFRGT